MKQLLIAGIDPGTTVGYAAIGIDGKLIAAKQAKELDLDKVVAELSVLGTILFIGTDKAKVPSFVSAAATKLGAKVFAPNKDMLVSEKRELTRSGNYNGQHEMDALASAISALKNNERLFSRIRMFLSDKKHPELFDRVAEIVVKQGISIRGAFDFLTAPRKEAQIMKQVIEKKQLKESDYWQLYDSLVIAQQESALLKQHNSKLAKSVDTLGKKASQLSNAVKPETRVIKPTSELEHAKKTIAELKNRLEQTLSRQQRMQHVLLNQEKYAVAKKLKNLGQDEFRRISKVLGFKKNDILFVDDCNMLSEKVIESLKPLTPLIIAVKSMHPKIAERIPFTIINASNVSHTQDDYFAFLDKASLEKARANKALLRKLIEDYQEERKGI
jgi:predicted RNase H-like nuclease (RuvC/YqgF family)